MRHFALLLTCVLPFVACSKEPFEGNQRPAPIIDQSDPLELIAQSDRQWSGVAVTLTPRTFVNYYSLMPSGGMQLAEIVDGEAIAYPNDEWNQWDGSLETVDEHWVLAERVVTDREYRIWVLDSGRTAERGVIPGAAKLLQSDPSTGEITARYVIDDDLIYASSGLTDVRIDSEAGRAYIVDGGVPALIVVDLDSGEQWRILDHKSERRTEALQGERFQQTQMTSLALHQGEWLYFANRFQTTLYRVPLSVVRADAPSDQEFVDAMEVVAEIGHAGGLTTDALGRVYYTDTDNGAIRWYAPEDEEAGTLVEDSRLVWPDSLACQDDSLFVTTSRRMEFDEPSAPYALYRIQGTIHCP